MSVIGYFRVFRLLHNPYHVNILCFSVINFYQLFKVFVPTILLLFNLFPSLNTLKALSDIRNRLLHR